MESFELVFGLLMVMVAILFVGGLVDLTYYRPITAENAKLECVDNGYDYAKTFKRVAFTTQPLGVECGIVGYEKVYIDIEDGIPVKQTLKVKGVR